ncbi:hypothetical protein KFU94_14510 [Chloroflexi bacterium TSY]|nr:hypothetical protein [Chloroflexi bacterium TSY]
MEISDSKRELTYVFKSMGTTTVRGTSFDSSKENPTALKRADFVVVVDDPKAFLPLVVSGKSALNRGIDNTLFVIRSGNQLNNETEETVDCVERPSTPTPSPTEIPPEFRLKVNDIQVLEDTYRLSGRGIPDSFGGGSELGLHF